MLERPGLTWAESRPIGVSIKPGATTFARTPRRAPSAASDSTSPERAAFDAV
jgi:hypothetical protein